MSRAAFAEALTRAMKRYPDMVDYLREMNRIAARFDAKRDPVSKNWVLPHGVTVSLEDLQAAYEGKPLPDELDELDDMDDMSFLE